MRPLPEYVQLFKAVRLRDANIRPDVPSATLFPSSEDRLDTFGGLMLATLDALHAKEGPRVRRELRSNVAVSKSNRQDLIDAVGRLVEKHGRMSVEALTDKLKKAKPNAGVTTRLVRELMSQPPLLALRKPRGPTAKKS